MAALLFPLDDLFAALSPITPAWVLSVVFAGMTVSVAAAIEHRTRMHGLVPAAPLPPPAATAPAVVGSAALEVQAELRGVLAEVANEAARDGVQLELAIPAGLMLRADRSVLRPVLLGLLRNAVAHAPGGRVFVGAIRTDGCVQIIALVTG